MYVTQNYIKKWTKKDKNMPFIYYFSNGVVPVWNSMTLFLLKWPIPFLYAFAHNFLFMWINVRTLVLYKYYGILVCFCLTMHFLYNREEYTWECIECVIGSSLWSLQWHTSDHLCVILRFQMKQEIQFFFCKPTQQTNQKQITSKQTRAETNDCNFTQGCFSSQNHIAKQNQNWLTTRIDIKCQ